MPSLPTPGQRVSGIPFPAAYVLPRKPDEAAGAEAHDAYRQMQFVLGGDLRLFAEGMNLQLGLLNDSSHSKYRTHVYAAVVSMWSRAYAAMADACLLITRGSYSSAPNPNQCGQSLPSGRGTARTRRQSRPAVRTAPSGSRRAWLRWPSRERCGARTCSL